MLRRASWALSKNLVVFDIGLIFLLAEYIVRYTFQSSHSIHRLPKIGDSFLELGIFWTIIYFTGFFDYVFSKLKVKRRDYEKFDIKKNFSYNKWDKILLFLMIILAFIYGVCTMNVPKYRTYSKFRFSFEHPEDMTVKLESVSGKLSCNDIGSVYCKNDNEELLVVWISNPSFKSSDSVLDHILNTVGDEYTFHFLGERTNIYNGINAVRFQRFYVDAEDVSYYGTYGVMNNYDHNRTYIIMYMNNSEECIDTFFHCIISMEFYTY